jgi:hypothetical protein
VTINGRIWVTPEADINIISTLLPYCDAMFVDNKCRALLRDIPRGYALPYGCKVFSPNTGAEFIQYPTEIRDSVTPDHLKLIEEVYGPDPMKPQSGIYGVGKHKRATSEGELRLTPPLVSTRQPAASD